MYSKFNENIVARQSCFVIVLAINVFTSYLLNILLIGANFVSQRLKKQELKNDLLFNFNTFIKFLLYKNYLALYVVNLILYHITYIHNNQRSTRIGHFFVYPHYLRTSYYYLQYKFQLTINN